MTAEPPPPDLRRQAAMRATGANVDAMLAAAEAADLHCKIRTHGASAKSDVLVAARNHEWLATDAARAAKRAALVAHGATSVSDADAAAERAARASETAQYAVTLLRKQHDTLMEADGF